MGHIGQHLKESVVLLRQAKGLLSTQKLSGSCLPEAVLVAMMWHISTVPALRHLGLHMGLLRGHRWKPPSVWLLSCIKPQPIHCILKHSFCSFLPGFHHSSAG